MRIGRTTGLRGLLLVAAAACGIAVLLWPAALTAQTTSTTTTTTTTEPATTPGTAVVGGAAILQPLPTSTTAADRGSGDQVTATIVGDDLRVDMSRILLAVGVALGIGGGIVVLDRSWRRRTG